jgi:hypothetical protein
MAAKGKLAIASQIGDNRNYLWFAGKLMREKPGIFKRIVEGEVSLKSVIEVLGYDFNGCMEPPFIPGDEAKPDGLKLE